MKKSLIALAALSAFGTLAQAQSSVSIYGVIDQSYGVNEVDQGNVTASVKTTGLADSANASSRIGFKGAEDLGGGLKAGFVLEAGLNVLGGAQINKSNGQTAAGFTSNDSAVFGAATRQAFVTVGSNNMGTLLVGYKKQLETDFNDTFMIGTENSYGAEGQELGRLGRANQIAYTLPTFSGLTASVGYTTAQADYQNATADGQLGYEADILSANLIYKAGKLTAGAHIGSGEATLGTTYTSTVALQSIGAFATGVNDYNTAAFGAAYDFGFVKVAAMYGERETGIAGGSQIDTDYTNLGLAFPMGKTTLKASLSQAQSKDASGNTTRDDKGYQFQADYSLSKRTTAWAIYGVNKTEAVTAASAVTGVSAAVTAAAAVDYKTMRVGLTHSF